MPQSSSVSIVWQDYATGEYEVCSISLAFNPGWWRESSHQRLWGLRMRENKTGGEGWEYRKMPQVSNSRRTTCAQAWHWKTFRLAEAQTGMKDKAKLEADSLKWDYLGASGSFTRALSSHVITTKLLELEMAVKMEAAKSDLSQNVKNTLRTKLQVRVKTQPGALQDIKCKWWSLVLGQWQWR